MINLEYITSLNPCQNRLANYIEHYSNFSGSLAEFLDLDQITHQDKLWVYFRSIPKELIPLIAADFAERVLHIYEKEHPEDDRPRKAIEAARNGDAAHAAAAAYAAHAAAAYAAYAAAAAAYAAHAAYAAAAYAANAAAYAANAAAYAAHAAAYAANAAANAADEEKAQIEIMKGYLNK